MTEATNFADAEAQSLATGVLAMALFGGRAIFLFGMEH